jgi:hypothetical protein
LKRKTGHFYFGENRTSVLWADTLGITGEGSNAGTRHRTDDREVVQINADIVGANNDPIRVLIRDGQVARKSVTASGSSVDRHRKPSGITTKAADIHRTRLVEGACLELF